MLPHAADHFPRETTGHIEELSISKTPFAVFCIIIDVGVIIKVLYDCFNTQIVLLGEVDKRIPDSYHWL